MNLKILVQIMNLNSQMTGFVGYCRFTFITGLLVALRIHALQVLHAQTGSIRQKPTVTIPKKPKQQAVCIINAVSRVLLADNAGVVVQH